MKSQRSFRQRMVAAGRALLFFLFVILVTALGVLFACEVAVRYPDRLTLMPAAGEGLPQVQFGLEALAFAVLYGFAVRRNWRRTLRISVGMLGLVMAFLSIAFYGFWLSHPSVSLQVAGRNTALASVCAFAAFIVWTVIARRTARCVPAVPSDEVIASNEVVNQYLTNEVIHQFEVQG